MPSSKDFVRPDAIKNATKAVQNCSVQHSATPVKPGKTKRQGKSPSRAVVYSSPPSPLSPPPVRPHRPLRRQRHKPSRCLTEHQVRLICNAAQHAQLIERPLNRFITIDWDVANTPDPWAAQSCFIRLVRDWLRQSKGGPATYVWAIENGEQLGRHSHMLFHIPPSLVHRFSQL